MLGPTQRKPNALPKVSLQMMSSTYQTLKIRIDLPANILKTNLVNFGILFICVSVNVLSFSKKRDHNVRTPPSEPVQNFWSMLEYFIAL
jgi:hypothetical protein